MSVEIDILTIATFNRGKLDEYSSMLDGLGLTLFTLGDHKAVAEVEETGRTFYENAVLKAVEYARSTHTYTLADDSGLEIRALGCRPGVLSARYGGDELSFPQKMDLVLHQIADSGSDDRSARFVCETAISDPAGNLLFSARGECPGQIASEPRGTGGFGYDPIFIPDGFSGTFGELSAAIKHQISHRGRAFARLLPYLRDNLSV